MENTYLFYDIETTGLNKCFDQILQFAAIRTDLELNELDRYNILIKLNPDVIPSPQAILTHNISVEQVQSGICEYEAIKQIHQLMNWPGTISLGYNSLNFDDEFLRFSFHRNLLPPYTHQYANNCSRMDLYPITVMYYLYNNETLRWPEAIGKYSLKLEDLNMVNGLAVGDAHDALVDVKITLELARCFIKNREMWDYLRGYFKKTTDLQRMEKLHIAIMVDGIFGADNDYQTVVMSLGWHKHYKNQSLWLQLDSPKLMATTLDSIAQIPYVVHKKTGETGLLLPYNQKFSQYLSSERLALATENKKWLQQNPKILQTISNYYKEYKYPIVPNLDIDAALYQNGFASDYEQNLCAKFHKADLSEKTKLLGNFSGSELLPQAIRLLGRNYPDYLPDKYADEFVAYLKNITDENTAPIDYKNQKHLTPKEVLQEINTLKNSNQLTAKQVALLEEWGKHISSLLR